MPRPFSIGPGVAALLAVAILTACSGAGDPVQPSAPAGAADPLREIAMEEGAVRIVVDLAVPQRSEGGWDPAKIAGARRKLLDDAGRGVRVVRRYDDRPQMVLEVRAPALDRLRASPLVLGIHLYESPSPPG